MTLTNEEYERLIYKLAHLDQRLSVALATIEQMKRNETIKAQLDDAETVKQVLR